MKRSKQTRRQRALDLKALLGRNSHLFSLKDVCAEAEINYKSTANNLSRLIKKNEVDAISDERLDALEEATLHLSETKLQSATA